MSEQKAKAKVSVESLPAIEKAAILLMSLGEENAAEILRHMGPKEVQKIGLTMAKLWLFTHKSL